MLEGRAFDWRETRRRRTGFTRWVVNTLRRAPDLPIDVPTPWLERVLRLRRHAAGLHRRVVTVNGHAIPYLDGGRGETVILVHGFADNKDTFVDLAAMLTPHYRVLLPDLLGFGEASRPDVFVWHPEVFTDVLATWINAVCGRSAKVHLGGNSLGGGVVIDYALKHAERLETLTLISSAGIKMPRQSYLRLELDQGRNPFVVETEAEYVELLDLLFGAPPPIPGALRRYLAGKFIADGPAYTKILQDLLVHEVDLTPRLPDLTMPTFLLWGDRDRFIDVSAGRLAHQQIPDSRLVVMHGVGHAPHLEAVEDTGVLLLRFLADHRIEPIAQASSLAG